ncbi:MAG TPA: hypothetical protein VF699_08995 [Caulobacteraceae bacterium]|jgi:hypothetical protein
MSLSVMAAVPTLSGAAHGVTVETLLQTQKALLERGGAFQAKFHSGSVISTVRNLIVADFLSSEADVLLMLDSDQGISGAGVMRMLDSEFPVVGCLYPKRAYDWSRVHSNEAASDMGRIVQQASQYVGRLDAGPDGQVETRNGFARALHVGTGVFVVRREAFTRLEEAYPELEGRGFNRLELPSDRFRHNWGFFNPADVPEEGGALSEDLSFCWRWRACGGELWADVVTPTVHVGAHAFTGAYMDYVRAHQPKP